MVLVGRGISRTFPVTEKPAREETSVMDWRMVLLLLSCEYYSSGATFCNYTEDQ